MNSIRSAWQRFRQWWGTRRLRTRLSIIIVIAIALLIALGGKKQETVVETVARQDLARTVAATGTVVSTTDLSLSFQQSGTVSSVRAVVGQKVVKGQVLATLSAGDEYAALTSAQGALLAAQARERKVLEGSSTEAVRKAEVAVENARRALYSSDLIAENDDPNEASVTRDPVITGTYNGTEEGSYKIYFSSSTNEARFIGIERGTVLVSKTPVPFGTKGLQIAFPAKDYSLGDRWEVKIPNVNSASYVSNVNAYRAAQADLDEVKASSRSADIDVAHADVVSAQGQVQAAQAAVEKTIVRAPAAGTVTRVDINPGDVAEAYKVVVVVQDIERLYVEADINESDVPNVAIDQPITITYDAFGKGVSYPATLSSLDLAPTIVDGIVNYKIKAEVKDVVGVRTGMTANLLVQTAFAPQVLVIPERTITEKDGVRTVEVLIDERREKTETRTITTGLRGDGGLVEVTSGLAEGDKVVFVQK